MADSNASSGGIGFLTIVFITLKLTHVIGWSWWWILAPSWIPLALLLVLILAAGALWLVVAIFEALKRKAAA